jgi:pyruvate formate lyase activating enzyme
MTVGGFQKISLSDFPGVISSILFTRGCGFRCPYCHNPELVDPARFGPEVPWSEIRSFLRARSGRIEGVVVTGGEPTVHADLPALLAELRSMGLRIKLDTNGSHPAMLRALLSARLVDFVAMDVKAPLERYQNVVRADVDTEAILSSIKLILESGCWHEFRTTYVTPLLSAADLSRIAELVRGCHRYVVQTFRGGKLLDPQLTGGSVRVTETEQLVADLKAAGHRAVAR